MRYYAVAAIRKKHEVMTPFGKSTLDLVWTDGMCGVLPVFTNKRKAIKYAGSKNGVVVFADKEAGDE